MNLRRFHRPPRGYFGGCQWTLCFLHFIPLSFAAVLPLSSTLDVSIPPLLEEGPSKGELLFRVIHDPEQTPENLTIPCKADALPAPSYSWFKNGVHFNTENERIVAVEGEGTLVIPDPQPEDEGDYQCVATNAAGSVFSDIANVRRSIAISFPKGEPRAITAKLGEPLSLTCRNPGGYPKPSLHWVIQKTDGSLRSVSSSTATVDDEGTLWFGAVTKKDSSDGFLYACASSSVTSIRKLFVILEDGLITLREKEPKEGTFFSLSLQYAKGRPPSFFETEYRMGNWVFLNVTLPPHFQGNESTLPETNVAPFLQHVSERQITVLKGEDLRVFCIYGGIPPPKVRWWKEDKSDINPSSIIEFGKVLHFMEIQEKHEGRYYCEAANEAGIGKLHSFDVNIESIPEFEEEPGTINQPIGESAEFRCSAKGEPEPQITWSFNGEPLEGKHEKSFKFEYLTVGDRGVIACNASNKHGYVYSTGFLNVLILPPEFTTKPENVSGLIGDTVRLLCGGYGSPDPEIVWSLIEKDGTRNIIKPEDEYDVSNGQLTIKSLNQQNSGKYECVAKNKYGEVQAVSFVKLVDSTNVDLKMAKERTKSGDDAIFFCEYKLEDKSNVLVTWMKDDQAIDVTNPRIKVKQDKQKGYLTIIDSRGSDSGVYSCVATSGNSQNEDFAILTVEDVPDAPKIEETLCSTREVYLKWTSGGANNSPIIGYKIQLQTELNKDRWHDTDIRIPASSDMTNSFLETSALIELHPGLTHSFRIIAINGVGFSAPSAPSQTCVAPGAPPDHNPSNTKASTIDSSTIQVTWNGIEPLKHNGPDFRYELSWKTYSDVPSADRAEWSKIVIEDWEQTEAKIEGLRAHTEYQIKLAAVNEHGAAPQTDALIAYTGADVPQGSPTNIRVRRITNTSAILFWIPVPDSLLSGHLKGYEVDVWRTEEDADKDGREDDDREDRRDADDVMIEGRVSHAVLESLEPFTEYSARVRVLNDNFEGPYSEPINFRTAQAVSSAVTNLEAHSMSSTSILVKWDLPFKPNGIITNYLVRYQPIYPDKKRPKGPFRERFVEDDERQAKFSDLEEDTLYNISVIPRNTVGLGQISSTEIRTHEKAASIPVPPVFSWGVAYRSDQSTTTVPTRPISDRDNDNDIDEDDYKYQNVILADRDGDGDIDENDVLDTDNDGDIDKDDKAIADIDNDGDVDEDDISAADRDGDGDIDIIDIGDADGDGDFDADDVRLADKDNDGDIDAKDSNGERTILEDVDKDGDIDEDDLVDVDGDGDIDEDDFKIIDLDNNGRINEDDLRLGDKDKDGDIDGADVLDMAGDGIDEGDLNMKDVNGDGRVNHRDYILRNIFIADTDGDGTISRNDLLDLDRDGDIDRADFDIADINNDGILDSKDVKAADKDGDGDVDADDIGDEDGDGDVDVKDVILADEDGDGDIDSKDDNEEGTIFEDRDGDGDLDENDVTDIDGDGDIDAHDFDILDVDDNGKIDKFDLTIIDKDGDGDVDEADVADFDGDGTIGEDDLKVIDKDGDGDIDSSDIKYQKTYIADVNDDGVIDKKDVLDLNGDGKIDQDDIKAADLNHDGKIDINDVIAFDRDGDGDIDQKDVSDFDGDGRIDEDDFQVKDRDGDGDIDKDDYNNRKLFLSDTDGDGDIDKDDVLDTNGDGKIDKSDFNVADINNDGIVNEKDVKAGDADGDGDVDFSDIGDEDGDGDIDGQDVIAADEDGDGDIDSKDDDGDVILLSDKNKDGKIDDSDVTDVDGDGDTDEFDKAILDFDRDGDVDEDDLKAADSDKDGDIDAADIVDFNGDGNIDGKDLIGGDRDGDGDIDDIDKKIQHIILADIDNDGDIDSEDILDTDGDGDIDDKDFAIADINNDGEVNAMDVSAGDQDGDGDIDIRDIGDRDGDGDVDGDDVLAADKDNDGDIDRSEDAAAIGIKITWKPTAEENPGSEFYIRYRPVGNDYWLNSEIEKKSLHQVLRGLNPYTAYEVQVVAKDGTYETPSDISVIGPFANTPKPPTIEDVGLHTSKPTITFIDEERNGLESLDNEEDQLSNHASHSYHAVTPKYDYDSDSSTSHDPDLYDYYDPSLPDKDAFVTDIYGGNVSKIIPKKLDAVDALNQTEKLYSGSFDDIRVYTTPKDYEHEVLPINHPDLYDYYDQTIPTENITKGIIPSDYFEPKENDFGEVDDSSNLLYNETKGKDPYFGSNSLSIVPTSETSYDEKLLLHHPNLFDYYDPSMPDNDQIIKKASNETAYEQEQIDISKSKVFYSKTELSDYLPNFTAQVEFSITSSSDNPSSEKPSIFEPSIPNETYLEEQQPSEIAQPTLSKNESVDSNEDDELFIAEYYDPLFDNENVNAKKEYQHFYYDQKHFEALNGIRFVTTAKPLSDVIETAREHPTRPEDNLYGLTLPEESIYLKQKEFYGTSENDSKILKEKDEAAKFKKIDLLKNYSNWIDAESVDRYQYPTDEELNILFGNTTVKNSSSVSAIITNTNFSETDTFSFNGLDYITVSHSVSTYNGSLDILVATVYPNLESLTSGSSIENAQGTTKSYTQHRKPSIHKFVGKTKQDIEDYKHYEEEFRKFGVGYVDPEIDDIDDAYDQFPPLVVTTVDTSKDTVTTLYDSSEAESIDTTVEPSLNSSPYITENPPIEDPTVGAVLDDGDPMLMTWFIIAVMVACTMVCVILFSVWVYNQRLARVSELRAQLYAGYEPPTVVEKKGGDVESIPAAQVDSAEPLTAEKQRQQMASMLRRQETVHSVDSFASHDDDFAEYGDETMGTTFNEDGSLIFPKA